VTTLCYFISEHIEIDWIERPISILVLLFLFSTVITLSRTWLLGYHTLRQIFIGSLFGLATQYGFYKTLTTSYKSKQSKYHLALLVLAVASLVAVLCTALHSFRPWKVVETVTFCVLWISLILLGK